MHPTHEQVEADLRALSLTPEIRKLLTASATLHEKDPEIIERWINFFINNLLPTIDVAQEMKPLL